MQDLIYKPKRKAWPTNIAEEILPDKICEYFVTKMEKIQGILMSGGDQLLDSEGDANNLVNELSAFQPATEEKLEKIIKTSLLNLVPWTQS